MAKYKNDPANTEYNAGDTFNYAVWSANTELTLCNVPWDAAYKDVVHFESTTRLNEFIDERGDTTTITNAMYARIDEPIAIDMPLGRAQRYNYIRVFNPSQPVGNDSPKYYYYFIRGVRHVSPQTTEIIVQLDVWQTYIRLTQFGRAYIERGHIGIANSQAFRNYGRDFLSIPEGIDTGASYVNVAVTQETIMSPGNNYGVLVVSTVDIHGNHGTREQPRNPSARPTFVQGLPTGAALFLWDSATEFLSFMADFSEKPWVTAGITSITLVPNPHRYLNGQSLGAKNPVTKSYPATMFTGFTQTRNLMANWRDQAVVRNYIPSRYRHLLKFLTAPYCQIEMSANAGSAVVLRPEMWNSRDAKIDERINILPPSQRIAFIPRGYNDRNPDGASTGDYLDMALFLSAFPTVPIVNNGQIQYLASNARSIASQYSSMDWANQRNTTGNQVAYDQATIGIGAGSDLANNAMGADQAQVGIQQELASQNALKDLLGNTAAGAGMGAFAGPGGAVAGGAAGLVGGSMGLVSNALSANAANRALAVRMSTGGAARDITAGAGVFMRDSNKGLADWAAQGDYANQRAAMDAKIQDTAMIPHGVSGQFGGETFNMVTDNAKLTFRVKMIDQAAMTVLGEYWLRYGYPVRRASLIPNDLRVMSKFSYWKVTEIYIRNAAMPESFKQTLRGILEKGVTVWSNANDVGVIDFADNDPLPGITLEGYVPPEWTPEPDPVDPEPVRKKRKKMLVFATNDGGPKYALAGSSPGTPANWIATESAVLKDSFLEACGVDSPVQVEISKFYELQSHYLSPVSTFEYVEGV